MFKGDFIKNLPKIYGTYTGGFAVFIILMAIAEQAGVSAKNIGVFLGYPLAYYMTAQGSLLAFVIMLFWTANKQEKIDEEHGFSEREDD